MPITDASARSRTGRSRVTVLAAVALSLALAACGSQLDPDTVASVNGNGANAQSQAGVDDGTGTDTGPGTDTGDTGTGTGDTGTGTGDTGTGSTGNTIDTKNSPTKGTNAPTGDGPKVSCDGFKNQTGITKDKIVIANASDISGPVPGIFESAQEATRAYAAYFNSSADICGRKLEVVNLDSRTDAGADQQAYTRACESSFAAVGSMSAFDSGGAGTAEACGLPDIRSTTVNPERQACSTCFAAQTVETGLVPDAMAKWFLREHKDATQHSAVLYINAGASPPNAKAQAAAWGKAGWKIDYLQGIDTSEFNFAPYVQQMKSKGIKLVTYIGPYQNTVKLQEAMKQQSFKPDVFFQDATIYDASYVEQAGDLGDGTYVYMTNGMFEDGSNKEMQLYLSWLQQVKPGATPTFYGLYAWSSARLFVEQALALGGKLDRKSLIEAVRKVDGWTSNGIHAKQGVGPGNAANCQKVIQLNDGKWSQKSPGDYMCGAMVRG